MPFKTKAKKASAASRRYEISDTPISITSEGLVNIGAVEKIQTKRSAFPGAGDLKIEGTHADLARIIVIASFIVAFQVVLYFVL